MSSAPPRSLEIAAKEVVRLPIDDTGDDGVLDAVERLQATGVDWTAVTAVHAGNADRGRAIYRELRDDFAARSIEFVPLVEHEGGGQVSARSVDGPRYAQFLIDVFEEWVRRDVGKVSVQMFDAALANWAGPKHRLGTITMTRMLDLVESPQQRQFGPAKRDTLPRFCLACDVRFACHGGCPKDRFAVTPGGEPGLSYLCDGYKAFFHHVDTPMRVMATFAGQGRSPAQIMAFYRAADAERDRNELCTCGSGRKWKRCHGMERPLELVR